jgi:RNA polymerase sigma-70 factor, ECF subfamily
VHCYRMPASYDESEDLVQETFLRAWKAHETFEGRSAFRAWLYRIATNARLDHSSGIRVSPRYPSPPAAEPAMGTEPPAYVPWLRP